MYCKSKRMNKMFKLIFQHISFISGVLLTLRLYGVNTDEIFSETCIEDLGCFSTGPPFYHPVHRPDSVAPNKHLHTKFLLYTRSNPDEKYILEISEESLQKSPFDPEASTKILVHGFLSDLGKRDVRHPMRKSLLKQGKYNVIVVDWTKENGAPYTKAVANARPTGAKLAKLINFLISNTGITAESVHIIAHSLGSHVAGYAGERVANLGRITALDPALFYFANTEPEVHLDPSDALFVDIIHTSAQATYVNADVYLTTMGHQDFFPNGGNAQPLCVDMFGAGTKKASGCAHGIVNHYFIESIESDCKFLGILCDSYDDYESGVCSLENSTIAEMGFRAANIPELTVPARFFLTPVENLLFASTK